MGKFRKIGVLTSGGDAPGMNASVRAIARRASEQGLTAVGIEGGYSGLIANKIIELTPEKLENVISRGGTAIYTDRCPEFKTEEGMRKAIETCRKNEIDAIIAIGGDGTFRGATDLTNHGIPTIGVTGTIDNDITATDYTVGFDTAQNTAMVMIDRLRDTCSSHSRGCVVELMGRDCGELALRVGIASGADAIVIPEIPFDEEAALENLKAARAGGQRAIIVCVSEGVTAADGRPYAEYFNEKVHEVVGIESRFIRLAHVQRGGDPTSRDRITASAMAAKAIDLLLEGKSNLVVCERDAKIVAVDINWALAADRLYKNKLKPGDLDRFTEEEVNAMKALADQRRTEIRELYDLGLALSKAMN